jgi:mRNA export factor
MDVGGKLLVVAAGNRKIDMVNLNSPGEIAKVSYRVRQQLLSSAHDQSIDSPLKWQSRCVAVFPGTGESFALGSVEGRVAIQYPTDE